MFRPEVVVCCRFRCIRNESKYGKPDKFDVDMIYLLRLDNNYLTLSVVLIGTQTFKKDPPSIFSLTRI